MGMAFWETILNALTYAVTSTAVIVAVGFLLRGLFQQLLSRDLARYQAELQAKNEEAKLRLERETQTYFFEYQTRFSLLHQRQSEAMVELYGMLTDAHEWIKEVSSPIQLASDEILAKRTDEAQAKYNELARYFLKHRPYLSEQMCEQIDAMLHPLRLALVISGMAQCRSPPSEGILDRWEQAWKTLRDELPSVIKGLERDIRASLSADPREQKI
jgi:hypothetical protein